MLNLTEILSATEKLGDISDPNDFLVELINTGLGQHMVLKTRQKLLAGAVQRAKQSVFLGGVASLGYDVVNSQYIINNHEATAVRLIFDSYAYCYSYQSLMNSPKRATGEKRASYRDKFIIYHTQK